MGQPRNNVGFWNELFWLKWFWFDQNVIWFLKILKIVDDGLGYKQKGQTSTTQFFVQIRSNDWSREYQIILNPINDNSGWS